MNKQQLAAKIWESANNMRGKIEANEYKDFLLGFIFYKFLSDKEVEYLKKQAKDYDGGAYYVPDFVLKLSDNNINTYIIIDAKYSELKTVKTYYASEIAFKYIFSLSPIEDNDYIKAVMIMYGKNIEGANVANLYDKQLEGSKIEPCFVAVPFQENLSIAEKKDQLGFILSHLSYSKRQK